MAVKCRACWDSGFVFGEPCMAPNCNAYARQQPSRFAYDLAKKIVETDVDKRFYEISPDIRKPEQAKRAIKKARLKDVGAIGTGESKPQTVLQPAGTLYIVTPRGMDVPHSKRLQLAVEQMARHTIVIQDPWVSELKAHAEEEGFLAFAVARWAAMKSMGAQQWLHRRIKQPDLGVRCFHWPI